MTGVKGEGVCPIWIPGLSGYPSTYLHLPEHHLLIPATRCQLFGVRAEADRLHTPLVTCEVAQDTARSERDPRAASLAPSPIQPTHPLGPADTWLLLHPTGGWCGHRRCWQRGGHQGRSGRISRGLEQGAVVRERGMSSTSGSRSLARTDPSSLSLRHLSSLAQPSPST